MTTVEMGIDLFMGNEGRAPNDLKKLLASRAVPNAGAVDGWENGGNPAGVFLSHGQERGEESGLSHFSHTGISIGTVTDEQMQILMTLKAHAILFLIWLTSKFP